MKKICFALTGTISLFGFIYLCIMTYLIADTFSYAKEIGMTILILIVPIAILIAGLLCNMVVQRKEKTIIERLTNTLKDTEKRYDNLQKTAKQMADENKKLKSVITNEHEEAINIKEHLKCLKEKQIEVKLQLNKEKKDLDKKLAEQRQEIRTLDNKIKELNTEIVELDEVRLLQSFGLYEPKYNLVNSEEYKLRLNEVRDAQKDMIKMQEAATCTKCWYVNDSAVKGQKMTKDNIKQILRCFNSECEAVINTVSYRNYSSKKKRIETSFRVLNRMNKSNEIYITEEYLAMKIEELDLAYEYEVKKQEEKEEARRQRELAREEEKLKKELERKREELEKEQEHYDLAKARLMEQIEGTLDEERKKVLRERLEEIEANLIDIDKAMEDLDYREANMRAGYIYVISNIGSFGEDIYKIGMTRRLEPMDRINELGDASVPFKFDVHALIFSDDAPTLEAAIHRELEDKKVNCMNNRKEFFRVSLKEVEEIIKRNYDKTVEFNYIPDAQQYRESLKMKEKRY